jgi:predicted transcriptional regulator
MIHRESFKATSISLPSNLMERLQELSAEVGEPVATVQRQVIRAAIQGAWTADVLGGTEGTDERSVVRLSLSPRLSDQTGQLRGGVPLSTWYRAALVKFLRLHDAGDRTIWNLRG